MGYESKIPDFKKELTRRRIRTTTAIGEFVVATAQFLTPVDTGRLRASIEYRADEEKVVIGSNVEYALYVEKGTRKQKAQPYLTPAVELHTNQIKGIVERYMS